MGARCDALSVSLSVCLPKDLRNNRPDPPMNIVKEEMTLVGTREEGKDEGRVCTTGKKKCLKDEKNHQINKTSIFNVQGIN